MRSIAWVSEKGGTGKTTSALNLAVALARRGERTLVVDADPQANATLVLLQGLPPPLPTLADVLLGAAGAVEAIRPTAVQGLHCLPADARLAEANLALAAVPGRERRLRAAMAAAEVGYDYVLVDTSPQRGLLTVNALNYAGEALVPVDPGLFALSGLGTLQDAVLAVARRLDNRRLRIAGILICRAQRTNVSRDVEAQLRARFGSLVLRTVIPHSVKVEEAHGRFQSVLDYAPQSAGARAYARLVEEIRGHGREEDRSGATAGGAAEPLGAA